MASASSSASFRVPAPKEAALAPKSSYTPPHWSATPSHHFGLEVVKEGTVVESIDISKQSFYIIGRQPTCDIVLMHDSISREHCVLQHRDTSEMYLYELGSTYGTKVNKKTIPPRTYVEIAVGDVIKFGESTRLYVVTGPENLKGPQFDSAPVAVSKSSSDSSSTSGLNPSEEDNACLWGQDEDAEEEEEEDEKQHLDYRDRTLTDTQRKLVERLEKHKEKMERVEAEVNLLRKKEALQGELTPGQQHQLDRCTKRLSDLEQQQESLELTIAESFEDEDRRKAGLEPNLKKRKSKHNSDDEDDFFDRTKQTRKKTKQIDAEPTPNHSEEVKTLDTLKNELTETQENIEKLQLELKRTKDVNSQTGQRSDDSLDSYMDKLSSNLWSDKQAQLKQQLRDLQEAKTRIEQLIEKMHRMERLEQIRQHQYDAVRGPAASSLSSVPTVKGPLSQSESKIQEGIQTSSTAVVLARIRAEKEQREQEEQAKLEEEEKEKQKAQMEREQALARSQNLDIDEAKRRIADITASENEATSDHNSARARLIAHLDARKEEEKKKIFARQIYVDDKLIVDNPNQLPALMGQESQKGGLIIRKKPTESQNSPSDPSQKQSQSETQDQTKSVKRGYVKRFGPAALPSSITGDEDEDLGTSADSHSLWTSDEAVDAEKEAAWQPPKNQKGDGKTRLNEKFGY